MGKRCATAVTCPCGQPMTPWAPVATPNPLGRGAAGGAVGAKHHITRLFRQPA